MANMVKPFNPIYGGGSGATAGPLNTSQFSGGAGASVGTASPSLSNPGGGGQGGGGIGGGGAGSGAGAGGGGGGTSGMASAETAGNVAKAGAGLLNPGSDYFQRLMDGMKTRLGKESGAKYRSAALRASQGGFGGGQSGELMDVQGDISRAGIEAGGEAGANLRLEAPKLGAGMALGAGGLQLGGEQLIEGGRQFDKGLTEGARKFDTGLDWQKDAFGQNMGQRQTEFGAGQGNISADRQMQMDMWNDRMSQAYTQLYGGSGGGASPF